MLVARELASSVYVSAAPGSATCRKTPSILSQGDDRNSLWHDASDGWRWVRLLMLTCRLQAFPETAQRLPCPQRPRRWGAAGP